MASAARAQGAGLAEENAEKNDGVARGEAVRGKGSIRLRGSGPGSNARPPQRTAPGRAEHTNVAPTTFEAGAGG